MSGFGDTSGVHRRPTNGVGHVEQQAEAAAGVWMPKWMAKTVAVAALLGAAAEIWHVASPMVVQFTGFATQLEVDGTKARVKATEDAVIRIEAKLDGLADQVAEKVNKHRR